MRLFFLLPALLTVVACKDGSDTPANTAAPTVVSTVPLRIATRQGARALTMELAVTPEEQEHGLMGRPPLPQGHGMLFPFTLPRTASFWMKDTPAALDLLFVRPDGTVAAILPGKPLDRTPISAGEPVVAVVEIAAGEAARLGLRVGDRAEWGDCGNGRMTPGDPINPFAFCPALP